MGDGWYRDYYHLSYTGLQNGDILKEGSFIGFAGSTGISTAPHLHIDEFSYKQPSDYNTNPNNYLKKSYDGGNTYIYFRDPKDYQ